MSKTDQDRADSGLTLVETLVVLAILSAVTALVLPTFYQKSPERQLASIASVLVAKLTDLRSKAILQNEPQFIYFDQERLAFFGGDGAQILSLPLGVAVKLHVVRSRVGDGIAFFQDGSASGGSIVISNGPASRYIDISWLTGAVLVTERP